MDIELRTIPGCPHGASAGKLFAQALALEGIDPAAMTIREIATDDEAADLDFHGSPTFTIDGTDLFPADAELAVTCRVYPTPGGLAGLPTLESLSDGLRAAARAAGTT
ncbi:hypothetical protein [Specibacter cremeus]|uniref:hypothetical protein n=1 Tax=Specibacter cremeus TaxID=1629051 RepID=UPI000F772AC5|nr:hypothetical protein [Specibacter cremeus]